MANYHRNMLRILVSAFCLVALVRGNTVCYDEIGCFSNDKPFYDPPLRPVSWLPESREEVGTQFLLTTRLNPTVPDILTTYDITSVIASNFEPTRKTVLVCHGYTESGDVEWMQDMATALLSNGDHNVILIDWHPGATALYGKATANTRIVGAEAALLINNIMNLYGISAESFHIIGHSLGAHVAGYAGERIANLGRITGLDPAGPYFEGTDPIVRLDATDADFVDVLHTDTDIILTSGMGIYSPSGHVDIYVNGGRKQPACDQGLVETIGEEEGLVGGSIQYVICNHLIAYDYFMESATDDLPWLAYECDGDWDSFKNGECFDTAKVVRTGFYGDQIKPENGRQNVIYYSRTNDDSPYGGYQYKVQVHLPNPRRAQRHKGDLYLTLIGVNSITESLRLTEEAIVLDPDNVYKFISFSIVDPGSLVGVQLRWDYDPDWYKWWDWDLWVDPEIYVNQIDVTDGQDGTEYTFCGTDDGIEANEDIVNFLPGTSC